MTARDWLRRFPFYRCDRCGLEAGPAPWWPMFAYVVRHLLSRHRWDGTATVWYE